MASTNKTSNLELSQFLGTDKPAWLTDYNADMQKIDNGYKNQADDIAGLDSRTTDLETGLGDSNTEVETVKNDVQSLKDEDVIIKRDINTLATNYDTIHHEVAVNAQSIEDIKLKNTQQDEEMETIRNGYMPKTGGAFTGPISVHNSSHFNLITGFDSTDLSANNYADFDIFDKNNKQLCSISIKADTSAGRLFSINTFTNNEDGTTKSSTIISCYVDRNGKATSVVNTPDSNVKGNEIVTASWVRNLLVSLGMSGAATTSLDNTESEGSV